MLLLFFFKRFCTVERICLHFDRLSTFSLIQNVVISRPQIQKLLYGLLLRTYTSHFLSVLVPLMFGHNGTIAARPRDKAKPLGTLFSSSSFVNTPAHSSEDTVNPLQSSDERVQDLECAPVNPRVQVQEIGSEDEPPYLSSKDNIQ